jgi:hypothetical protein
MHVDIFDSYVQARRQLRGFLFSVFLPKQLYFKLQMSDFKLNIIYNTISEALLRLLGMTDDRRQIVRLYVFWPRTELYGHRGGRRWFNKLRP